MTSPTRPMAWESEAIIEKAPRSWRISSAVPDHLAAAECDLVAIVGAIRFDLDEERRVTELHPVADGGTVQLRIGPPVDVSTPFHLIFRSQSLPNAARQGTARRE